MTQRFDAVDLEEPTNDLDEERNRRERRAAWIEWLEELDGPTSVKGPSRKSNRVMLSYRWGFDAETVDELRDAGLEDVRVEAGAVDRVRVDAECPREKPGI